MHWSFRNDGSVERLGHHLACSSQPRSTLDPFHLTGELFLDARPVLRGVALQRLRHLDATPTAFPGIVLHGHPPRLAPDLAYRYSGSGLSALAAGPACHKL